MKFSKREDIEVPVEDAFRAITDFPTFERAALRRGAEIKRLDSFTKPQPGMAWAVRAVIRGRARDITIRVTRFEPNQLMQCSVDSGGMLGTFLVELVELSRLRSRLSVSLELRAATMTSRLILQSARLAKGSLDRRFGRRVGEFSRDLEARHSAEVQRS